MGHNVKAHQLEYYEIWYFCTVEHNLVSTNKQKEIAISISAESKRCPQYVIEGE